MQSYRNLLYNGRFLQRIRTWAQKAQGTGVGQWKKHRNRSCKMPDSEIITILLLFYLGMFRTFKQFYSFYIKDHLKKEFPKQLSYNRFVEIEHSVFCSNDVFS
jgi:hypothetical protein